MKWHVSLPMHCARKLLLHCALVKSRTPEYIDLSGHLEVAQFMETSIRVCKVLMADIVFRFIIKGLCRPEQTTYLWSKSSRLPIFICFC